jgi:hypothetical protein
MAPGIRNFFFLYVLIFSSMAFGPVETLPAAVPVMETWGLLVLGAGVALAGVIGTIRFKKGSKVK